MRTLLVLPVAAVALLFAVQLGTANPIAAVDEADVDLQEAARLRVELGLDGNATRVANLARSPQDVGTTLWGIPMTREEEGQVDLRGRMAFADHVDTNVLPYLRSLPTFAGIYYRPAEGGRLTILLTDRDENTSGRVAALIANEGPGWTFETVKHNSAELDSAVERAAAAWKLVAPAIQPLGFGLDELGNGLFVEVLESDFGTSVPAGPRLSAELGVPVTVRVGTPGRDTHCTTNRNHCHAPMKSGINIYKGSNYSNYYCTMGFHISRFGDKQFLTAGHCGHQDSNDWYHPAFVSKIGSDLGSLYVEGGQDVMRVQMTDSEASDDIYNETNDIVGWGAPSLGETLCASLGAGSNTIKCGTVTATWRSWNSETANYTVWGGDMSYTTVGGDSGSPVFRRLPGNLDPRRAIGVNDHENGYFARLDQFLDVFAALLVQ